MSQEASWVRHMLAGKVWPAGCSKPCLSNCIWRAWIGPGIGARAFQVGEDVRQSFEQDGDPSAGLFVVDPVELGKWRADLAGLAERRLVRLGIQQIERSGCCTVTDQTAEGAKKFFSYRRDRQTGRMATLVWLG
jgi:copper oxidase (laccase) domain-containing protein